jgi:hypothetical protein
MRSDPGSSPRSRGVNKGVVKTLVMEKVVRPGLKVNALWLGQYIGNCRAATAKIALALSLVGGLF